MIYVTCNKHLYIFYVTVSCKGYVSSCRSVFKVMQCVYFKIWFASKLHSIDQNQTSGAVFLYIKTAPDLKIYHNVHSFGIFVHKLCNNLWWIVHILCHPMSYFMCIVLAFLYINYVTFCDELYIFYVTFCINYVTYSR